MIDAKRNQQILFEHGPILLATQQALGMVSMHNIQLGFDEVF